MQRIEEMLRTEQVTLLQRTTAQHRATKLTALASAIAVVLVTFFGMVTLRARRRNVDAIALSAATFRRLSDDNPDGVIVQIGEKVIYANVATAAMLRAGVAPMVGREVAALMHPDDRASMGWRATISAAQRGPTAAHVLQLLRDDGTTCEAEARAASIIFEGQPATQVVLRDLTSRREAEHELQKSEQRFRAVLQAMDEGVVLQDRDLTITLHNTAAERILGLSSDQLAGRTTYHPDWQATDQNGVPLEPAQHMTAIALRTGEPSSGVMSVRRPTMEAVWINVNAVPLFHDHEGEPYAVVATFADITAERAASAQLRESEARYRMLAQHSADLVSRRTRENIIEYASPSHEAILGWTPEELVGRDPYRLVHPDDVEHVRAMRENVPPDAYPNINARLQHKDGHYVWLEIATAVLHTDDGELDGFVVTARDVTARQDLEEKLRQSQKMEVLGRMASGVAHDFNNLLTVIRVSADLLRCEAAEDGGTLELVDDIDAATDRAAALTAHLLTFSRRRHAAPVLLQPAALLRDAVPLLRRLTGDSVTVDIVISDDVEHACVLGEAIRVEQVLINLVSNARDAMPDGGTVRISAATVVLTESVTHRFGVIGAGSYITLTVEDSGYGMNDDVLGHLFDPFYTTKPQGRGTGLGLSIVYGAVHEARGTITVSSEPGQGSRLTVYWPRAGCTTTPSSLRAQGAEPEVAILDPLTPDVAFPPRTTTLAAPIASSGAEESRATTGGDTAPVIAGGRILLVDDEESVRRVLAKQLGVSGYIVITAESGQAALEFLRNAAADIRAVVSDVRMPDMTGIELVETMLAEQLDFPVLLISGQLDSELPRSWPDGAMVQFLAKPLSGDALRRGVGALLARFSIAR